MMKALLLAGFILLSCVVFIGAQPSRASINNTYCQSWRERQMMALVNNHREALGFPRISTSLDLGGSAEHHSWSMATYNYFDHYLIPEGITWSQNITNYGYPTNTWRGEVIAAASGDPIRIYNLWLNSPYHNAVMLSPYAKEMGIGLVYRANSTYKFYWTIDSGSANTANSPYCS